LEASTLTSASRFALITRRSPLLRLQSDERLIALTREGNDRAFEALVERYQPRLHAFCRGMLGSTEDAEDVLQEVFVAAHAAIRADDRPINARPWLFRIARNRCLNHLRRPAPEGQDSMDTHPANSGASVDDRVQTREDFRALLADVRELPETQRTALLLRELELLSYDEIAQAMETTVPAVKSLLVRARMQLAECSQARLLTCDEVHLELAEAAEGLRKVSGPVRVHLRRCERCREYRAELRRSSRELAALSPIGPLAALYHLLAGKLGLGGSAGAGVGATGAGAGAAGAGAGMSGAVATGMAASGAASAIGAKAAAGVASVALITAGAVEVNRIYKGADEQAAKPAAHVVSAPPIVRYGLEERGERRRPVERKRRSHRAPAAAAAAAVAPPEPAAEAGTAPAPVQSGPEPGDGNAGAEAGVSTGVESGSGVATPPAGGSAGGPAPGEPGGSPAPVDPPVDTQPPPGEGEPQPEPEPQPAPVEPPPPATGSGA